MADVSQEQLAAPAPPAHNSAVGPLSPDAAAVTGSVARTSPRKSAEAPGKQAGIPQVQTAGLLSSGDATATAGGGDRVMEETEAPGAPRLAGSMELQLQQQQQQQQLQQLQQQQQEQLFMAMMQAQQQQQQYQKHLQAQQQGGGAGGSFPVGLPGSGAELNPAGFPGSSPTADQLAFQLQTFGFPAWSPANGVPGLPGLQDTLVAAQRAGAATQQQQQLQQQQQQLQLQQQQQQQQHQQQQQQQLQSLQQQPRQPGPEDVKPDQTQPQQPPQHHPVQQMLNQQQPVTTGYCRMRGCSQTAGFDTDNSENGCRSFHKHFLREIRDSIEGATRSLLTAAGKPDGTITLREASWVLAGSVLLSPSKCWQIHARSDSNERRDPNSFCTQSYRWVRRTSLGARVFDRDSGVQHAPTIDLPGPHEVMNAVFDRSKKDLRSQALPHVLKASAHSRIQIACTGMASVKSRTGEGRKQVMLIHVDEQALINGFATALEGKTGPTLDSIGDSSLMLKRERKTTQKKKRVSRAVVPSLPGTGKIVAAPNVPNLVLPAVGANGMPSTFQGALPSMNSSLSSLASAGLSASTGGSDPFLGTPVQIRRPETSGGMTERDGKSESFGAPEQSRSMSSLPTSSLPANLASIQNMLTAKESQIQQMVQQRLSYLHSQFSHEFGQQRPDQQVSGSIFDQLEHEVGKMQASAPQNQQQAAGPVFSPHELPLQQQRQEIERQQQVLRSLGMTPRHLAQVQAEQARLQLQMQAQIRDEILKHQLAMFAPGVEPPMSTASAPDLPKLKRSEPEGPHSDPESSEKPADPKRQRITAAETLLAFHQTDTDSSSEALHDLSS